MLSLPNALEYGLKYSNRTKTPDLLPTPKLLASDDSRKKITGRLLLSGGGQRAFSPRKFLYIRDLLRSIMKVF